MVFDETRLAIVRRAFARQMLAIAGVEGDIRLENAFAAVSRERFVGPPPWTMSRGGAGYRGLASTDPTILYQDILVALSPERGVNNGSPSLHAYWLHAARLREGESVAHIGCGTGYYTALIAELVGEGGQVLAVEFDAALASPAAENLADRPQVEVVCGDGAARPLEPVDCIYVNFSVERPAAAWLARLKPGGRLIFPLGVPNARRSGPRDGRHALHGLGLMVERVEAGFAARSLGGAFFVCAEGELAAGKDERAALMAAFEGGGSEFIRSLRWREPPSPGRSWFIGSGWSLSYDEPGA
ncbi:MAG TPA: methyltransferase domain-containing protein [Bosea sp. (in: a-proteobacteria)]|jgi:protein-L-isoaspartate(D-aspartate) O-methyltransferase|uniref:protein-L-isoaspartate O-methyltransferase family protein n=1 Tax=Bosea sp. (in: a-proteobacteria) TaxID=1871050 RepID=UPI002E1507A3|nr:methyltransferase domain-containing protein [Bosea sp. (in: a-proteobacteria)]